MESDAGYWTSPHKVTSIAFVCHIDDIKNDRFGCLNGIFNVFFVRYSCVSGTLVLMPSTFNQFDHLKSCIHIASVFFRQQLIYTINLKRFLLRKINPGQSCYFTSNSNFSEYWNCILKRERTCESIIITKHTKNLCKKRWCHNLSQKKNRLRTLVTTIIAESTEAVALSVVVYVMVGVV